jgi:hypothetical protein
MLIDFLGITQDDKIYFRHSDQSSSVFTSNNNLSFRRSLFLDKDNLYVDQMIGGEDMYICMKLISKGKKYLVDPDIKIEHFPRRDLGSLCLQFLKYGSFGTNALKHLGLNSFEVMYDANLIRPISNYKFLFKFKSPIRAVIHLNWFIASVFFALVVTFYPLLLAPCLLISLLMYIRADLVLFPRLGLQKAVTVIFIKTLINLSFTFGAISRLFKDRLLYIPPAIIHPYAVQPIITGSKKWKVEYSALLKISEIVMHKEPCQEILCKGKYIRINIDRHIYILKRRTFILEYYQLIDVVKF